MTQPTHDEVIAFLNSQETNFKWLISNPHGNYVDYEIQSFKVGLAQTLANRDVLERHKVDEENYILRYEGNDNQVRYEMCMCGEDFPCPTYLDIYNRIREVM